jgi:hypothetical protein
LGDSVEKQREYFERVINWSGKRIFIVQIEGCAQLSK